MTDEEERIAALEDRMRTSDPANVYEDIESLPSWWQEAVREFESHDLRPYRPSQFTDDEIVREIVDDLEEQYDVEIDISAKNPTPDGPWTVRVDGESVTDVEHRRKPEGYTVYGISSERFEDIVANAAGSGDRAEASRDSE